MFVTSTYNTCLGANSRHNSCIIEPIPPKVVKATLEAKFNKIGFLDICLDQDSDLQLTDKGNSHAMAWYIPVLEAAKVDIQKQILEYEIQ